MRKQEPFIAIHNKVLVLGKLGTIKKLTFFPYPKHNYLKYVHIKIEGNLKMAPYNPYDVEEIITPDPIGEYISSQTTKHNYFNHTK